MEQLLLVLVLIFASGDAKSYTDFSYSKEWDSAKRECRKEIPKNYSHRYQERDRWTSKCARGKLRKLKEVKP